VDSLAVLVDWSGYSEIVQGAYISPYKEHIRSVYSPY